MAADQTPASARRLRDYPPFFIVLALIAILALILPNSLRVPPQDPPQVAEYAPVPPQDNNNPNPNGNLSTLALGSGSTLSSGVTPPPPPPTGSGSRPSTKHCVKTQQTDDPNSPPCVPFFTGNNGGITWQGVSKDEIRAVVYLDTGNYLDNQASGETSYPQGVYDVDKIPDKPCPQGGTDTADQCAFNMVRAIRALALFFNGPDGFQTYNRRVHFWVQIAPSNPDPSVRRNDAQAALDAVHPFAALHEASLSGYGEDYVSAIAARNTMVFSSNVSAEPEQFYRQLAPFAWGFWPDVEHWAKLYSTYICEKVAGKPVVRSGNGSVGSFNGQPRKYGVLWSDDPAHPSLKLFHDLVMKAIAKCGIVKPIEATFPYSGYVIDNHDSGAWARQACTTYQTNNVTTLLYLGGTETKLSSACNAQNYFPEVILAGDLENDGIGGQYQPAQTWWGNTLAVSYQLRADRPEVEPGYQAALRGNPNLDQSAAGWAATLYRDFFMLFQGIQIAGPRLTPQNVDKGFHAVPSKSSKSPYVASCFFDPGDYTCVKDSMEQWYDPQGQSQQSTRPGCWRVVNLGKRYLAGTWPAGETTAWQHPNDPCNNAPSSGTERLA